MIRKPVVAGQFYPSNPRQLKTQIEQFLQNPPKKLIDARAIITPHAGYIYSGKVAGAVFREIKIPPTAIILGPNHSGLGSSFSIISSGLWQTPLGEVKINQKLAEQLQKRIPFLQEDPLSHSSEHSIEVQVPFLKFLNPKVEIIPISINCNELAMVKKLGEGIAEVIKGDSILLIASTDFTHYEPHEVAKEKDHKAIEAIKQLNAELLCNMISSYNITMCGHAPVLATISCVKYLGCKNVTLVKYETSGDVSGDYSSVVGYGGLIIN
jgi:hypothetical protein